MFYFVYVPNFLSRTIRSVLNCCVALRHPAKIDALRIYYVGSASPELLLEAHTLTRNETYQFLCGSRAESHSMVEFRC